MGYYATSELTVHPPGATDTVIQAIRGRVGYNVLDDEAKWYDDEVDLCHVSKALPYCVITVVRTGEDGMMWAIHARNGEVVRHQMPSWQPPPYPEAWNEDLDAVALEIEEQERAELARLQKKYGGA